MSERLQKVLARAGLGSRRELERQIAAGAVRVNDAVANLGQQVAAGDRVRYAQRNYRVNAGDGHRQSLPRRRVVAYCKPEGEVTTRSDPEGRPTVYARLPRLHSGRWMSVGRLDLNTSGLLLFSNDGELVHRLTHPSRQVEREYAVRVFGEVEPQLLQRLKQGVQLDDGKASFDSIRDAGGEGRNHWYHVVLREGRNREVRRLWESQGCTVSRLMRVRYGPVKMPRYLERGRWMELEGAALEALLGLVDLLEQDAEELHLQPEHPRQRRARER